MIFNAAQIGINVNLSDLSVHTFFDLNEYAAKILKDDKNEEVPCQSISEMRKSQGKNYG